MDQAGLTGKLLLAMPGIGDPRFQKSVIYVCAHDENGAMGLVVNQEFKGINFVQLLEQLGLKTEITIDLKALSLPCVMQGGPVETERGFLLHSQDFEQSDTVKIGGGISVTGTTDALREVAEGHGPDQALMILGYSGWTSGQLEAELERNAWLSVDCAHEILFHGQNEQKWDMAVKKLGFDPNLLSGETGRA